MKLKLLCTLGLIVLSMFAFATSPGKAQTPDDQTAIVRNKLEARIKDDINKIEPRIKNPLKRQFGSKKDTYYAELTGEYSMDIKTTDSIISPFTGIVDYNIRWYANSRMVSFPVIIKAIYAYQDGQWVFKSAKRYAGYHPDRPMEGVEDAEDVSWVNSLFQ
jgi:hypothetical protein